MKDWLVGTAMVVVIVAGGLYIRDHVQCWDMLGIVKGCSLIK